jgi:ABC-type dipeptide/oligopeptide/nickel transport system permease subunit
MAKPPAKKRRPSKRATQVRWYGTDNELVIHVIVLALSVIVGAVLGVIVTY